MTPSRPPTPAALPGVDPYALLSSLVLDTGQTWGSAATTRQREDAAAVLDLSEPARQHYLTRPRGGSKSTDGAALVLVILLTQAPADTTSHVYAADGEQAALLLDKVRGLAERTTGGGVPLAALLDFTSREVRVKTNGARLRVEPADAPSAFGHTPFVVLLDEAAAWPETETYRTLRRAVFSGLPKRPDSRLIVLTSAGAPGHSSARLLASARVSTFWRVSEMPGPVPWLDPAALAAARENLTDTEYRRDILNEWAAGDEMLTDPDDLTACLDPARRPLDPDPRHRYVVGVDGAVTGDRYAVTVCHAERPDPTTAPVVVLDRLDVFAGTKADPIDLSAVGEHIAALSRLYGNASVEADPAHIAETVQRLKRAGVKVTAEQRNTTNNHAAATNLYRLLRARRMRLPDDPDLTAELLRVRLRESTPGRFRLDAARGHGLGHGDRASALSYAALALVNLEPGRGSITVPTGNLGHRATKDAAPVLPVRLGVARAARLGPRGMPGGAIVMPGSANAQNDHDRAAAVWNRRPRR